MRKFKRMTISLALTFAMALGLVGCAKDETGDTRLSRNGSYATSTDATTTDDDDILIPDTADLNSPEAKAEQERFDEFCMDEFRDEVTCDTVSLHYTVANPANYGIDPFDPTLGDMAYSKDEFDALEADDKKEFDEYSENLRSFNRDYLTDDQKLTYDILTKLSDASEIYYAGNFSPYLYEPFAYTSGLQGNYPITMSEYILRNEDDVIEYLALMDQTDEYFNSYLAFEDIKSAEGLFMSDACADEVIRQCDEFIAPAIDDNLLVVTFNERIDALDIDDAKKAEYKEQNKQIVQDSVILAYNNTKSKITELKGTGSNELGLCYLDGGKEYYKYLILTKVGTDKTPEEIIELLDQRIDDELKGIYTLAAKDYNGLMAYYEDDTITFEDANVPLEEIIEEIAGNMEGTVVPELGFEINYSATPVHESLKDVVSPAFYMTPAIDDYLNGTIHTNLKDGAEETELFSTLCHEGVPGHMYQFIYFLSSDPAPIRTALSFNGYEEGWATYVENMSFDYNTRYTSDTYKDMDKLNNRLNLLVSARIEIGVNYEGWTLDETKQYMEELGFGSDGAEDIMKYVIAEPANYQMYCIGWLSFLELQEKAEKELGSKFVLKDYTKAVLDCGPCQFKFVEEAVDRYIRENK